jgi:hypothetical protein
MGLAVGLSLSKVLLILQVVCYYSFQTFKVNDTIEAQGVIGTERNTNICNETNCC